MDKSNKEEFNLKLQNRTVRMVGDYITSGTKTEFTDVCGHIWSAIPDNVLQGSNCPFCAPNLKLCHQQFLDYLYENNIPILPLEEYITATVKIKCQCTICNHIWPISPNKIKQNRGCPNCAKLNRKLSEEQQIKRKQEINEILSPRKISLTGPYTNARTKTEFYDDNCKHHWIATPDKVLQGQGCSICNTGGFNPNKPAILYYVRIIPENLFKIGITNRSVEERYKMELHKIETIFTHYYEDGFLAYNKEQEILSTFAHLKYQGPPILESGNTEIFNIDVIDLLTLV
jgi:hypothetical protein